MTSRSLWIKFTCNSVTFQCSSSLPKSRYSTAAATSLSGTHWTGIWLRRGGKRYCTDGERLRQLLGRVQLWFSYLSLIVIFLEFWELSQHMSNSIKKEHYKLCCSWRLKCIGSKPKNGVCAKEGNLWVLVKRTRKGGYEILCVHVFYYKRVSWYIWGEVWNMYSWLRFSRLN